MELSSLCDHCDCPIPAPGGDCPAFISDCPHKVAKTALATTLRRLSSHEPEPTPPASSFYGLPFLAVILALVSCLPWISKLDYELPGLGKLNEITLLQNISPFLHYIPGWSAVLLGFASVVKRRGGARFFGLVATLLAFISLAAYGQLVANVVTNQSNVVLNENTQLKSTNATLADAIAPPIVKRKTLRPVQSIPDTGGGLSGFVGRKLWLPYRFFPSPGNLDWLLLFFSLMLAIRVLLLPLLWKAIRCDMNLLKTRTAGTSNSARVCILNFWCLCFLLWFFHTTAGRTFIQARSLFTFCSLVEVNRVVFWSSLVAALIFVFCCGSLAEKVASRNKSMKIPKPRAYPDRDLLSLFGGGGVFFSKGKDDNLVMDEHGGADIHIESTLLFLFHCFYWYWTPTSLVLIQICLLTIVVTEAMRILFVFILHRCTFG